MFIQCTTSCCLLLSGIHQWFLLVLLWEGCHRWGRSEELLQSAGGGQAGLQLFNRVHTGNHVTWHRHAIHFWAIRIGFEAVCAVTFRVRALGTSRVSLTAGCGMLWWDSCMFLPTCRWSCLRLVPFLRFLLFCHLTLLEHVLYTFWLHNFSTF